MPVLGRPGFLGVVGLGVADSDLDGLGASVELDGVGLGVGVVSLGAAFHLSTVEASTVISLLEPMMMVWLCFSGVAPFEISSLPA